jgi:hypothetical protein
VSDWFSQRQSDAVIYAKLDGFRSALEEATRLAEVTDVEASLYRGILKECAAPVGKTPQDKAPQDKAQRDSGGERGQPRQAGKNDLTCAPDQRPKRHNCTRIGRSARLRYNSKAEIAVVVTVADIQANA